MKKIAILDDETDILELISVNLKKHGFEPVAFDFVDKLFKYIEKTIPDMIILDLMLNETDGFEVCKQIRNNEKYANIPIIMLTAKNEETDKIIGLEIGADDYVTKPFSPRELIARIKAIFRRLDSSEKKPDIIQINNDLEVNISKFEVKINKRIIALTSTEFKILVKLLERKGWVYSRDQLLDYLWGNEKIVIDRTIDVHIKNLREKLGEHGKLIKNVRGIGYKIDL